MTIDVGQRVRQLRNTRGWSQEALAASAKIKVDTLIDLEKGKRTTRPQTLKKIADALVVDAETLMPFYSASHELQVKETDQILQQSAQFEEMVRSAAIPMIDPARYLSAQRRHIALLLSSGDNTGAVQMIKKNIKSFCISAEIYSTMVASEDEAVEKLRFGCSAAMDGGIGSYAKDDEWRLLLMEMGQSARVSRKEFIRVIFIDFRRLYSATERFTLTNVILDHIRNFVTVALFPAEDLSDDTNEKKNMAIFGNHGMLATTDQVAWDLGFFSSKGELCRAIQKHEYFVSNAVCVFRPGDDKKVSSKVSELLGLVLSD